ncbi:hypothetical protein BJ742DRAFT_803435, partial [Cladochytrium replicatum]
MPPTAGTGNATTATTASEANVANTQLSAAYSATCAATYCRFVVDFALPALFRLLTEHPAASRSKFSAVCDQLFRSPLSDSEIVVLRQESEKLYNQLAKDQARDKIADDAAKRILYRTYVVDYAIPAVIQLLRTNTHTTKEEMAVIQGRLLSPQMLSPPEITVLLLQFENLYRTISTQPPQEFFPEKNINRAKSNAASPKRSPSRILTNSVAAKFQENRIQNSQHSNAYGSRKPVHRHASTAPSTMSDTSEQLMAEETRDNSTAQIELGTPQTVTQCADNPMNPESTNLETGRAKSSTADFFRTFLVDYALPAVVQFLRDRPSTTRAELAFLEQQLLKGPLASTEIQVLHSECDSLFASIIKASDASESSDTDSRGSNPPQPQLPSRTLSMPQHLQSTVSKPIPLSRSSTAPAVLRDPVRDEVHSIVQEACKARVGGFYRCPRCDRAFSRRFNLRIHVASTHCNVKEFLCEKCGKAFARRHDMRRHCRYIHDGGDIFKYKPGPEESVEGEASEVVGMGVGGALDKPMATGGWSITYTGA